MGYAARANLRSHEGGKPKAFVSLHRVWRGVAQFKGDRLGFEAWIESRNIGDGERDRLDEMWRVQNPEQLVQLATQMSA